MSQVQTMAASLWSKLYKSNYYSISYESQRKFERAVKELVEEIKKTDDQRN